MLVLTVSRAKNTPIISIVFDIFPPSNHSETCPRNFNFSITSKQLLALNPTFLHIPVILKLIQYFNLSPTD